MNTAIIAWKSSLGTLLNYYEAKRGSIYTFFPILFLFFAMINIACYWWAMFTAFPELTHGIPGAYYFNVQFPVGILGALFDSLSFFVTLYIIRRALLASKNLEYVTHLSLDLVIAILATFWVLFVFSFSGWIVHLLEPAQLALKVPLVQNDLVCRNVVYTGLLVDALEKPADNTRNIYFGVIMGVSAMLPTCGHVFMFIMSFFRTVILHKENRNGKNA